MGKNSKKTKNDKANKTPPKEKKARSPQVPDWYTNSPSQGADIGKKSR